MKKITTAALALVIAGFVKAQETDPQVGTISNYYIPKWNGTALVTGTLQDKSGSIGLNKTPDQKHRFSSLRQVTTGSASTQIFSAIRGENNQVNTTTVNSVGYLGFNDPGSLYQANFPQSSIRDIGVLGVKHGTNTEGAGVFALNFGTATTNYGLYSAAIGSNGYKYGVYALATGAGTMNRAIYAKAEGALFNYAVIVPENGGKSGFGWSAPSATLGVMSNGTDDAFKILNSGFTSKFLVNKSGNVAINTTSTTAALNIGGTDQTVIVDGTNPYIQMNNGGALTGYIRASGLNFQVATNAENDNGKLEFRTNGSSRMWIDASGSVAVGGAGKVATGYLFSVAGKLMAEEVRVELNGTWPDYVFQKDYKLMKLGDLKRYIDDNSHLPEIPAAAEMKNGVEVGKMNKLLMQKVEELTLYVIQLHEEVENLKKNNK